MKWNWKIVRDPAFFLLGAGTFIHEVTVAASERPTILAASLALMGVPVFLRKDEAAAQAVKAVPEELAENQAAPGAPGDPEVKGEIPA